MPEMQRDAECGEADLEDELDPVDAVGDGDADSLGDARCR